MKILVIAYHSYKDPICKGLLLEYIKDYIKKGKKNILFELVTFESYEYRLGANDIKAIEKELSGLNIYWKRIPYHNGTLLLLKKVYDLVLLFLFCWKRRKKYSVLLGFTSLSGSLVYIISSLLKMPFVVMNVEPHSDYLVDFGDWKRGNLKYKILRYLERQQVAKAVLTGIPTTAGIGDFPYANTRLLPTSINVNHFNYTTKQRNNIRNEIGATTKDIVLVYLGKFGGIYYTIEQVKQIYTSLYGLNKCFFFYVITPNQVKEIHTNLAESLPKGRFYVRKKILLEEVRNHLSASDIGMLFIPPFPSQKYRCPIKTANYLACGIPYIINKGVSDDDIIAEKEGVGVSITDIFNISKKEADNLAVLCSENKDYIRKKCKEVVVRYRGIENTRVFFDEAFALV